MTSDFRHNRIISLSTSNVKTDKNCMAGMLTSIPISVNEIYISNMVERHSNILTSVMTRVTSVQHLRAIACTRDERSHTLHTAPSRQDFRLTMSNSTSQVFFLFHFFSFCSFSSPLDSTGDHQQHV